MNNYVSKVTVYIRGDNTAGIPDNSIHIKLLSMKYWTPALMLNLKMNDTRRNN